MGCSAKTALAAALSVLAFISLISCGGGGSSSGGGATPVSTPTQTIVSGTVQAPGGAIAFFKRPSLGDLFESDAYAALTGLANVPDNTIVQLARLNATATSFSVISTTTTSGGGYAFNLMALGLQPTNDLIVRVAGPSGREMRAFVVGTVADIGPVSEAAYQLAIQSLNGRPLNNLTLQEIGDISGAVSLIAMLQNIGNATSVDQAVGLVRTAVSANVQVTGFITAASAAGQATGGTGDIGNFIPLSQGNSWNYRGTKLGSGASSVDYTNAATVNGSLLVGSVTTTVFASSNPGGDGSNLDEYLVKDSQALRLHGDNDRNDPLLPAIAPYTVFRFPLHANNKFQQVERTGLNIDIDGDGETETVSISSTVSVLGFESVTVAASSFSNVAKVVQEATITAAGPGGSFTATQTDTTWLAPGVGVIRKQSVVIAAGSTETSLEELTSYQVEGNVQGSLPGVIINRGLTPGEKPSIASNGSDYLLLTCSQSGPTPGIIGVTITDIGRLGTVLQITPGNCFNGSGVVGQPVAAFNGSNYLVVYKQGTDVQDTRIRAKRISAGGVVLDGPEGILISPDTRAIRGNSAVGFDGTNYLVAWSESGSSGAEIYGARVSPTGQNLGVFPITEAAPGFQAVPQIAFDGTNFLVVWSDFRGATDAEDVYATRVTPGGVVLDPTGIPIASSAHLERNPQLAFDGTNYLIAWHRIERQGGGLDNYSIRGTRMTRDGVLLDGPSTNGGIPINTTTHEKRDVALSFDGNNFIVAWTVGTNSFSPAGSIMGTKLNPNGQVVPTQQNPGGFLFSDEPPPSTFYELPTISSRGNRTMLAWLSGQEGISRVHGTLTLP